MLIGNICFPAVLDSLDNEKRGEQIIQLLLRNDWGASITDLFVNRKKCYTNNPFSVLIITSNKD